MKVLVVAAHPDDEVIGCGGTIARHVANGDVVYLLILTEIYAPDWDMKEFDQRKKEALSAAKVLGIKEVMFGGFPTVKLNTVPTIALTAKLQAAVAKYQPQVVYIPPRGDINADHDAAHRAALVGCRPLFNSPVRKLISYEIAPTTRFNPPGEGVFAANYYLDISKYLKAKLRAMRQYRLELRKDPHPRSLQGLTVFARERGLAIGVDYAEAFCLLLSRE